ncbi:hypothetical protein [Deinococcus aquaedulcis]|uniref:hypothetical protein n=1 Tax=Deinococcus aquaedulcis TaxID=2840455 RepID=UPI001C828408|nr:hypothetical protein [Deinococcus aquaedulcis]
MTADDASQLLSLLAPLLPPGIKLEITPGEVGVGCGGLWAWQGYDFLTYPRDAEHLLSGLQDMIISCVWDWWPLLGNRHATFVVHGDQLTLEAPGLPPTVLGPLRPD